MSRAAQELSKWVEQRGVRPHLGRRRMDDERPLGDVPAEGPAAPEPTGDATDAIAPAPDDAGAAGEGADAMANKTPAKRRAKKAAAKARKAAVKPAAEKQAKKKTAGFGSRTVTRPDDLALTAATKVSSVEPHGARYVRVEFENGGSVMLLPVNLNPADTIAMRDKVAKWLSVKLA